MLGLLAWLVAQTAAEAAICPADPAATCPEGDVDCDGAHDDTDPCPFSCKDDCGVKTAACSGDEGCAAGTHCTEADRCARSDAACDSGERYVDDAVCVPRDELDGLPDVCTPHDGREIDTAFCGHFTRSIGFLGLFGTPYGMAYGQRTSDGDLAVGFELFVVGRLGRFRYHRGTTTPPRWSYYLAAFGNGTDDDAHLGGRLGLRYRFVDAPLFTRLGGSLQYMMGEAQADGDRSQFPGLLVDVEFLGSLAVGLFAQLDATHDADPGAGLLLRLDLDELRELGILR